MKTKELSLLKRIFVFFCCTVFLSSSVFTAYSMTVYAADDYDIIDAANDVLNICIVIGGLIFAPATDGISILVTTRNILGLRDSIEGLRDYITDNGDGTYIISPEFVQAVMDAAEQLEEQGFSDSDVAEQGKGLLYVYKQFVTKNYKYKYNNNVESWQEMEVFSTEVNARAAGCRYMVTGNDGRDYTSLKKEAYYYFGGRYYNLSGVGTYTNTVDGNVNKHLNYSCNGLNVLNYRTDNISNGDCFDGSMSFGANFPIFSTADAMYDYLKTGKGYKDAENYHPTPIFRRHSAYSPTYSGGAVTVNRTVIENITQKITEVDSDDSLSDDEKIDKLRDWISSGGIDPVNPDPDLGDTDYEDNKDLPAGTELADTNSWLKKIYLKVCQIFDELHKQLARIADDFESFFIFEDAPGINAKYIASLLESIHMQLRSLWDEIHKQLAQIAGDVSDIKGQLETISEQEFNERSDSFLGEIMDALSEISEVVKTKFPFSIPNDLRIFLSKIAPAAPETEEQQPESYSLDTSSGISLYSGEHGGGGISDGETNPPGGGGASRPGSGFIDVEHGGGGGSRDPVEMREAPVFRLPIVIERYGIEEYIIIDMAPFDPLSRFSRGFFTIIFMVCLFNLTFKVIGMWGDLIG